MLCRACLAGCGCCEEAPQQRASQPLDGFHAGLAGGGAAQAAGFSPQQGGGGGADCCQDRPEVRWSTAATGDTGDCAAALPASTAQEHGTPRDLRGKLEHLVQCRMRMRPRSRSGRPPRADSNARSGVCCTSAQHPRKAGIGQGLPLTPGGKEQQHESAAPTHLKDPAEAQKGAQ